MSYLRIIILSIYVGACSPIVPATTPPQLEYTPGAFVVVTDEMFDAGIFRVDYPKSWRVVKTSIASTNMIQVVFVAPDESSVTLTQVESGDNTLNDNEQFTLLDNGIMIQSIIMPSEDADERFLDSANQLISSIRAQ